MPELSNDRNWKLRIVVAADLNPGQKLAQAIHAAIEFTQQHPRLTANWHQVSNSVVILETKDLEAFREKLFFDCRPDIVHSCFYEPDLDNKLTAIALEPTEETRKLTSSLRLALRDL